MHATVHAWKLPKAIVGTHNVDIHIVGFTTDYVGFSWYMIELMKSLVQYFARCEMF